MPASACELTEDQAQQRGLAGAVGADQAHLVAALDAAGKIAHHDLFARSCRKALADTFEFGHQLAGSVAAHDAQIHLAQLLAPRRTRRAQVLQALDATDAARAPRLDALPDPDFFLRQHLVGARIRQRLFVEHEFLALLVGGKAAGKTHQIAAIEFDDARRHAVEENPVVGDDHDRALIAAQQVFQPEDAIDIEMIGRLVEQQQFRLGHQRPGQGDAFLAAAGKRIDVRIAIQRQARNGLFDARIEPPAVVGLQLRLQFLHAIHGRRVASADFMGHLVIFGKHARHIAEAGGDGFEHRIVGGKFRLLRHIGDGQSRARARPRRRRANRAPPAPSAGWICRCHCGR